MAAELQLLDLFQRGLGKAAIQFVATGHGADVVDTIRSLAKAAPLTLKVEFSRRVTEPGGQTGLAVITGTIPPGPELARLLAIREATSVYVPPHRSSLSAAERLLEDFSTRLFAALHSYVGHERPGVPWATIISLKTLFAHVRELGGTMVDLFLLLMRNTNGYFRGEGSWAGGSPFTDYVRRYPAAFGEALLKLDPKVRLDAVKLGERHGAFSEVEAQAALVAMLTAPFDKKDREIATSALGRLAPEQLLTVLERELPKADINARYGLVLAAGRCNGPEIRAFLAARAKFEKAGKVQAAIQAVVETGPVEHAPTAGAAPGAPGYAAIDGSFVAVPERKDLGPDEIPPPADDAWPQFLKLVERIEERRRENHAEYVAAWVKRHGNSRPVPTPPPVAYAREVVEPTFATLTTAKPLPSGDKRFELGYSIAFDGEGQAWFRDVLERMPLRVALQVLKAAGLHDATAVIGTFNTHHRAQAFAVGLLRSWIEQGRIDLRDLASDAELRRALHQYQYRRDDRLAALKALPGEAVWPWVAENVDVLDEALGMKPTEDAIPVHKALDALALLPAVPQRYFAKLLDIAVSEKRPLRRQAMALLRGGRDLVARIEALLDDKRQQVRVNAAVWLADIRSTASEGALRKRLNKEKSDPVRAALIESLQRMGFDLSDVIGPATLIAEAEAACAKAAPELPAWLTATGLPAPHFRDGTTVPPVLVRHWLALAIRLKDASASGQFGIYLDQLTHDDARAFSNWVLDAWISFDTYVSSLDEATAYAAANYQNHFLWMCRSSKTPELREQAIAAIVRERTREPVNSGSETKGILALACRADPVFAANRVRWFLKKHGRRASQAMALLEVLAGIGHPAALQVVIAASTRLKQKSTQAHAAEIAERYAEDRGWSFDELADRAVPSAGFDDDGVLELSCGEDEKLYTARLDATLAIHLLNPEGKPVKSLPAGDDEATKGSKKAFAAAKKELAQVVELQRARLFEAMCVERAWPVADWRLAFHEHPVMRRLVERLVWQGLDEEGRPLGLFRPTQEGDFTGAGDDPVEIDSFAKLRLAHGALVDQATCEAWLRHLKDYEVKPFLAQFDTLRAPLSAEQGEAEAIVDRQGWKADSLALRGVAEKRGYERVARDGGWCSEYEKTFSSHGITATIFHTGAHAVDENNPVALKELRFAKEGHRGTYRLKDVPPVMLAECWADYHAVAAKGAFDPEWEKLAL